MRTKHSALSGLSCFVWFGLLSAGLAAFFLVSYGLGLFSAGLIVFSLVLFGFGTGLCWSRCACAAKFRFVLASDGLATLRLVLGRSRQVSLRFLFVSCFFAGLGWSPCVLYSF